LPPEYLKSTLLTIRANWLCFIFKFICLASRGVDQPSAPQQFREVALYPKSTQGRPQQAELSGAAHADEEMDDGAVCFRWRGLWAATCEFWGWGGY
jgi:hypothetical protein